MCIFLSSYNDLHDNKMDRHQLTIFCMQSFSQHEHSQFIPFSCWWNITKITRSIFPFLFSHPTASGNNIWIQKMKLTSHLVVGMRIGNATRENLPLNLSNLLQAGQSLNILGKLQRRHLEKGKGWAKYIGKNCIKWMNRICRGWNPRNVKCVGLLS